MRVRRATAPGSNDPKKDKAAKCMRLLASTQPAAGSRQFEIRKELAESLAALIMVVKKSCRASPVADNREVQLSWVQICETISHFLEILLKVAYDPGTLQSYCRV